jgi:broad-specificity NMP kinase
VQRLLLLGGPPGVGKTTVAPLVAERLSSCAWVEADELWRMSPVVVDDRTRRMVESNIVHVLREFLDAAYEHVVLCWVLHDRALIERLVRAVASDAVATSVVHLVATPDVVRARVEHASDRGRSVERALEKLAQIEALPYRRIDTSTSTPEQVADVVASLVRDGAALWRNR